MSEAPPALTAVNIAPRDPAPAAESPVSKRAIIDGQQVDLRMAAAAYRSLVLGIGLGLAALVVPVLLSAWFPGLGLLGLLFWPIQIAAAVTMGIGYGRALRALGEFDRDCDDRGVGVGVLGLVPILGMLPAAFMTGKLHQILNAVGVPLGLLGPSRSTMNGLRHGICHQCGYDLTHLLADRCPECNADVAGDKSPSDAVLTTVEIVPDDARSLARICRRIAWAGIGLGAVQLALCVIPLGGPLHPALAVFLGPGLVFGAIASTASFVSKEVLRERWTADFVAVGIISIVLPPIAGALLLRQATRLSTAAARGRAG